MKGMNGVERVAIERTVSALRAEGRDVAGIWYPDESRDPVRLAGRSPVEAAMTIDGRPAGLDVTTLWTPSTGQAAKRVATWRRRLEGVLKADVIPGWTAVAMEYDPALLTRGEFLDMEAQLDATAATIRSAAQATAPGSKYKVPASDRPRWVTELKVFRAISDRSHVSVTAWAPKRADAVAEAMERIRVKKGAQLAGWGLGIVAIASTTTFDDSGRAEEQLLSRGDWPFWRVYWVNVGGAHLLWDRDGPHG